MGELFLSVLNMSLTASYVILFVILIRLLLKKAPKIISYALWGVVAFRLIIPFSFESIFSLMPRNINTVPIPHDIIYQQSPQINSGIGVVDSFVNSSLPEPTFGASVNPLQIYVEIGAYIWVLGIIALLVYSLVSILILKRQLKSAQLIEQNIFEAKNLKTPFVLGLIKPKIYLPVGLNTTERSYILLHEQIHIQRKDHIIKVLAFLTLSIHWFNPFVWIAFILMSTDMELSCDERVLKEMDKDIKKPYANSLLSLATEKHYLIGSPLAFGEGNVKGRIKNVMNYKKPRFWVVLVSIIILIGVGIALLSNPTSPQGMLGENEFEGRIAIITEDVNLKNPYAITVDTDNKTVYQALDNIEVSLNKNDMVIVIEEDDEKCRVVLIAGDTPACRGTIEKNKLSYDTSLFENNANQAIVKDAMSYDGIDGNEKGLESGIGMVIERKDDWARVALPMLESDLWFKSDSLSYEFDTSIIDIKQ